MTEQIENISKQYLVRDSDTVDIEIKKTSHE